MLKKKEIDDWSRGGRSFCIFFGTLFKISVLTVIQSVLIYFEFAFIFYILSFIVILVYILVVLLCAFVIFSYFICISIELSFICITFLQVPLCTQPHDPE